MALRKLGGRQMKSRRIKANSLLGQRVTLNVSHPELLSPIALEGVLVKKSSDAPYTLRGTEAKIPLTYAIINPADKIIDVDLSECAFAGHFIYGYRESQRRALA